MTQPVETPPVVARPGRDWARMGRGLCLVGIGSALLLNTTGRLPWAYWVWLLDWWPVVLVAAGIRLVFDRSRFPALVLLSPLLGLGTMALVAVQGPPVPPDEAELLGPVARVERPADLQDWQLEVSLGVAELTIEPGQGPDLVRGQSSGRRSRLRLEASRSGRVVRARAGWPAGRWMAWPGRGRGGRSRLEIAPDAPLALELRGGMSHVEGDLSRIPLRSLTSEGGFNDIELRLGAPVGRVPLRFAGGFTTILLHVPAGTRVDVRESGALNFVQGAAGESAEDNFYRVEVEGAFQSVEIMQD